MRVARLADRVVLAWGWPRRLIALLAGASGALALAPLDIWPLAVIPMVAAVWLLDGAVGANWRERLGAAFFAGWFWGFGYFLAGLWWLGAAFLVEADKFAWAMPLGVVALPAALAVFPGLGFALARLIWPSGSGRILVLAVALTLSEWLRGHLFTGFPWNVYGMMLAAPLWLAQTASVVGLYGLTLLTVLAAAAPATLADESGSRRRWSMPAAALLLLAAMAGFGLWRVPAGPSPDVAGVKLRIMQPNLAQDAKFNPQNGEAILRHYLTLSDRATRPDRSGVQDITHLIWPESAFPFLLGRTTQALARIGALLPPGVTLVTGAARAGETLPGETRPPIYNAVQVLDDAGAIVASYDKVHLVPFGEYLPTPFARAIRAAGLSEFVAVPGGFSSGARHGLLTVAGLPPVAPLICYEAVFPGEVVPGGLRPGLMLNLTNDGWFGRSSGPYQHLAQARLRTIEEGLPLVRAANTGISAVVDAYGRTTGSLPLGTEGVLDLGLPQVAAATPYSQYGDAIFACFGLILLLIGVRPRAR